MLTTTAAARPRRSAVSTPFARSGGKAPRISAATPGARRAGTVTELAPALMVTVTRSRAEAYPGVSTELLHATQPPTAPPCPGAEDCRYGAQICARSACYFIARSRTPRAEAGTLSTLSREPAPRSRRTSRSRRPRAPATRAIAARFAAPSTGSAVTDAERQTQPGYPGEDDGDEDRERGQAREHVDERLDERDEETEPARLGQIRAVTRRRRPGRALIRGAGLRRAVGPLGGRGE